MSKFPFDLTVGSDPEFMVRRGDEMISAIPIMGAHGKDNPMPLAKGFAAFADNVNLEMNIPPSTTADEFASTFKQMFEMGNKFLKKHDSQLHVQASHEFGFDQLTDEAAMVFGCRAEECAYYDDNGDQLVFEAPDPFTVGNLRSCGGHVHIGRSDFRKTGNKGFLMDFSSKFMAIRFMDIFAGIPLTFIDQDPTNLRRKRLYGKPGSFRDTVFGVEWRAVSNFWTHHPEIVKLTFDLTKFGMEYFYENPDYIKSINPKTVFTALETADKDMCHDIMESSPLPGGLKERVYAAMGISYTGTPTY